MTMAQLRVTSKALPEHNRQHNRSLLLQLLFHNGVMSRADLARESGLTRVTVSTVIADLTAEGLILEHGQRADARVGKPAQLIGLNADAFHVIALDLSADDLFVGAITTLRGDIVHRIDVPLGGTTGEEAVSTALAITRDLVRRSTVRVLGIGVATPGIIGHDGVVREAPNLGWTDLDLGSRFRAEFDLPLHIANDANAATLAIHTFDRIPGRSLMVIAIEHGVGAGIILGDVLVEGDQFSAGEIGHVVVDEDGERCACGRNGCLELAIAVPHLHRRLRDAGETHREEVLAGAGHALGIALAPVVATLNLNTIVLAGPAELIEGPFLDAARQTVRRRTLGAVSDALSMSVAPRSDELALRGATVLVLSAELRIS